jgi:prepilin-type N-terminal cleavage/methylation domain-containing protein
MPTIKRREFKKGFTLVETLISIALIAIVFSGIFGAYRLGMKMVWLDKAKTTAMAIGNGRIEMIRGLDYGSVGTTGPVVLPWAKGVIDPIAAETANGIEYTIATSVIFVSDPRDGLDSDTDDSCIWDYKKAAVRVSWDGKYPGEIVLSTDIAPGNQNQEAFSCTNQPGGILTVKVSDSAGIAVPLPFIDVYDINNPDNILSSGNPAGGTHSFPLEEGSYRIVISKSGYSHARTYGADELSNPDNPDKGVYNGKVSEQTLFIDPAAIISIDGISPSGFDNFSDTFENGNYVELNGAEISGESITLSEPPPYPENGSAISKEIMPANLVRWEEFTSSESEPAGTAVKYQILYFNGAEWTPVPDDYIGGNSAGLIDSPISLSGVPSAADYQKLKIKAVLLTTNQSVTPRIDNWRVSWVSDAGLPASNAVFHLRGTKTIGKDGAVDVYKYSQDLMLDASGHLDLTDMDGDRYYFSTAASSTIDVVGANPLSPVNAPSESVTAVKLFLSPENSLLLSVSAADSLTPVFGATVRLVNLSNGYDSSKITGTDGQTYFMPLQDGVYDLEIQSYGYENYSGSITISGQTVKSVDVVRAED